MAFDRLLSHARKIATQHRLLGPALILLTAGAATAPILLHGPFCGDDLEFHMVSWFDVQQSWRQGVAFPHWMPSANYGAGEPRFLFYPPLTWMLGAALGFVLPWRWVPAAMIFLFLVGTGWATRALARQALPDGTATLAGCAAVCSGFALFTAYERTAFAELTGGFWIPLLLLFALRDRIPVAGLRSRPLWFEALNGSMIGLALVVAGAWLSDGPVGLMSSYLLAAVSFAASILGRTWTPLLRSLISGALGVGLAALYLVPVAREQSWVDLTAAADYPVFKIENNWLFERHAGSFWAPFDAFLHRASVIGVAMIAAALLCALLLFARHRLLTPWGSSSCPEEPVNPPFSTPWWVLLAWIPVVVLFLQLPISLPVWNVFPKLRFLQYPWRWDLLVEAPMAIFCAAVVWPGPSTRRPLRRGVAAVCALVFFASIAYASRSFLRTCKDGETTAELREQFLSGRGLEGADEYEPLDADHWKIAKGLPDGCFSAAADTVLGVAATTDAIPVWRRDQGSCEMVASSALRQPEHLRIDLVAPHAGFLILKLLSFPAWRMRVNDRTVEPSDARDDGLMAVAVPQGPVQVTADWSTTPDVIAGRTMSAAGLVLLFGIGFTVWKRARLRVR